MADTDEDLIEINVRLPRGLVRSAILDAMPPADHPAGRRLALAKWALGVRRRRSKIFNAIQLGEPSWDMMLDLYVADREGRRVDVSGLCLASGVPPSTALRYVDLLANAGHIARIDDEKDGRRAFITISATLREMIEEWLDHADESLSVAGLVQGPT